MRQVSSKHAPESGGQTDVDRYLAALPADMQTALQRLRKIIRAAAPQSVEGITYQIPASLCKARWPTTHPPVAGSDQRHL
jgi:hypothetical protein